MSSVEIHRASRRTIESIMEAPDSSYPVVSPSSSTPFVSCLRSRLDPVVGNEEGVFQNALPGKYNTVEHHSPYKSSSPFSLQHYRIGTVSTNHPGTAYGMQDEIHREVHFAEGVPRTPGRVSRSIMEAPSTPRTVETAQLLHQSSSGRRSRPGPVSVATEGVFQPALPGKYLPLVDLSLPEFQSNSSPIDPVFTIYYQNVRGLRTKTNELRLMLESCDYDVVALTETWLREDIQDGEISSSYHIFRCDRNQATSRLSRGGGVLIAVKAKHSCAQVSFGNFDHLEQVTVRINLLHRSLFITGIYLRPLSNPDLYTSHTETLETIFARSSCTDIILALGDYNLPCLNWKFDEDVNGYIPSNACKEQEIALTEPMLASGLTQVNSFLNANGRLLDLAFISEPDAVELLEPPVPLLDVDHHHKPFILILDAQCRTFDATGQHFNPPELSFKLCDFDSLNNELSAINWTQLLEGESVDCVADLFYNKLYAVLFEQVPIRQRSRGLNAAQPWWTRELRNLRNVLRKARKRFFNSRTNENKNILRLIEIRYNEQLNSSYGEYVHRTQTNLKQNPSEFWKFVKSQRSYQRIPETVSFNGTSASSPDDVANMFASFFQTVYSTTSPVPHPTSFTGINEYDLNFPTLCFSPDDVQKALEGLDESKGPGVDGIPPSLLKYCARSLASPISCIFNRSMSESTFPSVWKMASIVPIHKAGNRSLVENYRGISLLSCISKVFETLVHNTLYSVVHPVISEFQHGFVQHRSTTTNLLCYSNTLFREVESRKQVDSIYVDFSKAFDTVPHLFATEKLKAMGLPTWFTEWILSYLTDRQSFVAINFTRSKPITITSGVPQGSVLGPMIFVLFVNDLCPRISSFKQLFADDLKMYRVIETMLDCLALQNDINELLLWCNENGMRVNIGKCKVISFTRRCSIVNHQYTVGSVALERVSSIRDLGVTIDSKLRFNEHVALITAKASTVLGCIRRYTWQFTDIYAQKTLFCTLVRSILEYAASVWAPHHASLIIRVERIQKLFIRFALRNLPWMDPLNLPDYTARCKLIDLETLHTRRTNIQKLLIFDILRGNIDCPQLLQDVPLYVPPRQLRNPQIISVPTHRTTYGYNNPFDACLRVFNEASADFDFEISKNVYKNRIKNHR